MRYRLLLLLLLPLTTIAQINITGKVINGADNKPVPNASVFLSNATIGAKTADDGIFTLSNVKSGQYEFVVSAVGFDAYRQTIMAQGTDVKLDDIMLMPKTIELKEVTIKPGHDREQDVATFTQEFLGTGDMAKQCIIQNPDILNVDYDSDTKTLTVNTTDFLLIDNEALGYHIKYLLTKFTKDNKAQMIYFEGSALFTEMDGTPTQKRRWAKRRREVYEGSSMHFLRSVIANKMSQEGFKVMKLNKVYNFRYQLGGTEPKYNLNLDTKQLSIPDFISRTDEKGLYALAYKGSLYIQYTKKKDFQQDFSGVNKVSYKSAYPGTAVTVTAPYGFFDNNGIITNPGDVVFEGYWGIGRIAELLPVDYEPENVK